MKQNNPVTIFYACDDRYIPYLSVSLISLIENASKSMQYNINVLCSGIEEENEKIITDMSNENISIKFVDVSAQIRGIASSLSLRDYYSLSIYYRIFIPELFPNVDKAIYLDSDTVVLEDIAELYGIDMGDNLVAAVQDMVVASEKVFRTYADMGVGVRYERYFNSGVLLMNLREMRLADLQGKFMHMLKTYHFDTICPDQDYLNVICKDKVHYLGTEWNKMSVDPSPCEKLRLIHYNMFFKPWLYSGVLYQEHFCNYAKASPFYANIIRERDNFGDENKRRDAEAGDNLRRSAERISKSDRNFRTMMFSEMTV